MRLRKSNTKRHIKIDADPTAATSSHPHEQLVHPTHKRLAWAHTRKGKIIISIISLLIIVSGATWLAFARRSSPKPMASGSPTPSPTPVPTPLLKEAPLTGVMVAPELITKPVMGVVIENLYPDARPQSGLSQAGVVYEALAEGGITRYVAFFQTDIPTDIGPVRSLRPIFYTMGMEYNAPVAHVGGSTDGLALARSGSGFKDIDQFYNGGYFRRITQRWAPHNVYITGESLQKLVADKGWATAPTFTSWKRKDDSPSSSPTATKITADFSGPDYIATFQYDPNSDSYLRSTRGQNDIDASNGNKQLNPKTVIILYTQTSSGTQPNGKPKTDIDITGTGKALLFQDGTVTECSWKKASDSARLTLIDPSGQELSLNRGQSWVSILPIGRPATWQ